MDDAIEGSKELLHETVKAFKTGLHGEDYIPGAPLPAKVHVDEELKKLEELRASGTLSEEEFAAARTRVLQHADPAPGSTREATDTGI